jgi:calnexin
MQKDILFDNIYIGHSVEDANVLKAETYDLKIVAEKAEEDASKPKVEDKPKSPSDLKFFDDPVHFIREKVDLFITIAQRDPIQAIKFVPEVSGPIGAVLALLLTIVFVSLFNSGAAPSKQDVKDAAKKSAEKASELKDKAADAVATGTEKAKEEVQKRTTRSSDKSS